VAVLHTPYAGYLPVEEDALMRRLVKLLIGKKLLLGKGETLLASLSLPVHLPRCNEVVGTTSTRSHAEAYVCCISSTQVNQLSTLKKWPAGRQDARDSGTPMDGGRRNVEVRRRRSPSIRLAPRVLSS
jgi:hypothetical protein